MKSLTTIENLFIDMDGVLYHGNQVLPGAKEFIELLQEEGTPFLLVTNNSTLTPTQYVAKLRSMGVEVAESEILTSGQATALYLEGIAPPGTRVHVMGEEGLLSAVLDKGYEIVDNRADIVVVGMDRDLSYEKLKKATVAIRSGARFIATNPDKTFPAEEGILPGAGALLAALEAATDVAPFVVGKPQPAIFDLARSKLGVGKEGTAVIGDRLETDILGGHNAGLITILLLSGVTTRQDLENYDLQPDFVFEDICCLCEAWRKRR